MRIGLLEDNPSNSEYLQTLLTLAGHQVFPHLDATSFMTALATGFHQNGRLPYDLAILDLMLPGPLSGQDVIRHIWETYTPLEHFPLIVISGAPDRILDEVRTNYPTIAVLRKPFKRTELLALIASLGDGD